MLVTLSALSSAQATATINTNTAVTQFLNYCATHPDASITYHRSDMILKVPSDALYLNEKQARSRTGGHFYMGNTAPKTEIFNGSILVLAAILKHVMSSAAEAEIASLFTNAKEATILRTILDEMGHPQPPTPIQTDNSTASGIANDNIKQQRSRAIDMRFYWVRDRVQQGHFVIYWGPGSINLADYFTKHHSPAHHQQIRHRYVNNDNTTTHQANSTLTVLRGCVETSSLRGGKRRGTRTQIQNTSACTQGEHTSARGEHTTAAKTRAGRTANRQLAKTRAGRTANRQTTATIGAGRPYDRQNNAPTSEHSKHANTNNRINPLF
jgi:hypothetical protein